MIFQWSKRVVIRWCQTNCQLVPEFSWPYAALRCLVEKAHLSMSDLLSLNKHCVWLYSRSHSTSHSLWCPFPKSTFMYVAFHVPENSHHHFSCSASWLELFSLEKMCAHIPCSSVSSQAHSGRSMFHRKMIRCKKVSPSLWNRSRRFLEISRLFCLCSGVSILGTQQQLTLEKLSTSRIMWWAQLYLWICPAARLFLQQLSSFQQESSRLLLVVFQVCSPLKAFLVWAHLWYLYALP